jgi:cell division protein FtsA
MKKKKHIFPDEIVVGLDIGTTKIAVIVGRMNNHNKLEILGFGSRESHGVKRGVVNNINSTVEAIREAVEMADEMSNVQINEVYVGIAGQHIRSLQNKHIIVRADGEKEIDISEIEDMTKAMYKLPMHAGEEILHVIPQEYILDSEHGIKAPAGMCGTQLEGNYHIITGQIAAIKNLEKCVIRAELERQSIMLEPLASAASVLSQEEMDAGIALVDIGGGTTDVAVFYDGILRHTAVIPLGGDIVTEDIKEGCSILKYQAEALKVKFGSALAKENSDDEIVSIPGLKGREPKEISLRNLAGIIQSRMDEIIGLVYHEIKSSGYENKLVGGIVLTGGGAMLRHLGQLTEFKTTMDTRIGYPSEHLSNNVPKEVVSPMYATTIGLVLKGFEQIAYDELINGKDGRKKNKDKWIWNIGNLFFPKDDIK